MNHHSLQRLLVEVQNLVSCPDKIYKKLYLSTLSHFMTQCQTEELKQRLTLTIIALKLRRGVLFPKKAGAEAIAAEEAQWTYALFSAALLSGLQFDLIKKVIPNVAENWLSENDFLYSQWKEILFNTVKKNNQLNIIIQRAFEITG